MCRADKTITVAKYKKLMAHLDRTLTYEMKEEKGNPLSRAKDQVWRDAVAAVLIHAEVMLKMRTQVMIDVPTLLCVAL